MSDLMRAIEITEPGESTFLIGELIDREEYGAADLKIKEAKGKRPSARPMLPSPRRARTRASPALWSGR